MRDLERELAEAQKRCAQLEQALREIDRVHTLGQKLERERAELVAEPFALAEGFSA